MGDMPVTISAAAVASDLVPGAAPASLAQSAAAAHSHGSSAYAMFLQADVVVKAVMLGLLAASLVTWTVWIAKSLQLARWRRRLRRDIGALAGCRSLVEAATTFGFGEGVVSRMIQATAQETRISEHATGSLKERVASHLDRIETANGRSTMAGTGILATIGSTAPFVGLFGTVWGIMNAFVGISKAQTTNLAVVAPGIAEALLATAFGLVAAIPAVVIYNGLSRSIAGYRVLVGDAAAEVQRLVSRDLDRHRVSAASAAAE